MNSVGYITGFWSSRGPGCAPSHFLQLRLISPGLVHGRWLGPSRVSPAFTWAGKRNFIRTSLILLCAILSDNTTGSVINSVFCASPLSHWVDVRPFKNEKAWWYLKTSSKDGGSGWEKIAVSLSSPETPFCYTGRPVRTPFSVCPHKCFLSKLRVVRLTFHTLKAFGASRRSNK